jgi:hypothetical protein
MHISSPEPASKAGAIQSVRESLKESLAKLSTAWAATRTALQPSTAERAYFDDSVGEVAELINGALIELNEIEDEEQRRAG